VEINRRAPATAEGEIEIAATPEVVWDVISDVEQWPTWNNDVKSATLTGPLSIGSVFRWKSGLASLTSTLRVVDPPRELGWTGTSMSIRAIHVFRFEPRDGGTLAHSEESWEGFLASLFKGYSRKALDKAIQSVLAALKAEAERRGSVQPIST
jgi:carbon monoxide dehydrogenase subunit G